MLKEIFIQNIILINSARIDFSNGFNVISGETGSGKSAILEAIALAFGSKTDVQLIRHGENKGCVEICFDISNLKPLMHFLSEKGIEIEQDELVIKREIYSNGKSRAFINHQVAQLSLLKNIGKFLINVVNQHDNHQLFELSFQREYLDIYSENEELLSKYQEEWKKLHHIHAELNSLQTSLSSRAREMDICSMEVEEIENAKLKEGEEEELFTKYSFLSSSQERLESIKLIENALYQDKGILSLMHRIRPAIVTLQQKDAGCEDFNSFQEIQLGLEELGYAVRRYLGKVDCDPKEMQRLEERLSLWNKIKKKYGSCFTEIQNYLLKQKKRLEDLHHLDHQIETINTRYQEQKSYVENLANELSQKRIASAKRLEKEITLQINELNMQEAEFHVHIERGILTEYGLDKIEYFLATNKGEKVIPLREGVSGGELARVLLSFHVLIAGKKGVATLIFDEVDANIGGTTAAVIGNKLQFIGKKHQVLCITHFPQVAKLADHHLQISKTVHEGRTFSSIQRLTLKARDLELARMAGLKK